MLQLKYSVSSQMVLCDYVFFGTKSCTKSPRLNSRHFNAIYSTYLHLHKFFKRESIVIKLLSREL